MKLNEVKRQVIKEDFKPGDRVRFTSPRNATEDGVVVRTLDSSATEVKFDSGEKRGVFTTSLTLLKEAKDIRLLERQLIAIEKKMSAKDDPCWKGYHMVGTKNKNGREVPNCVPGKKGVTEGTDDLRDSVLNVLKAIYDGSSSGEYMIDTLADEFGQYYDEVEASGDQSLQNAYSFMMDNGQEADGDPQAMAQIAKQAISMLTQGVAEGAEFGSNYAEQLAQKVFNADPGINNEDAILNAGYAIAKKEMGSRANGIFRNEDFPSDFVSAYGWLKKNQGVAESNSDYNKNHGSPYDRGAADSYYHRPRRPHKGGVGGGSGEESTKLTPEEIKAYHAGYDWNERHGDKKIWDSKDNNQSVSEADEPGDVRTKFALQKARGQFPMAKSDAEALALYINRKEQKDVDELGAENDYEDMMIDQLSKFDDKIDQEVDELQRQIDQLKRHAGIKSESVVEGSAESMIKHVKDARAFMNSGQPDPKTVNRAGYNAINSKEEWLEKVRVMHQVQNDPKLKDDAEAQEAIRQRIGDLNRVGLEKGWA